MSNADSNPATLTTDSSCEDDFDATSLRCDVALQRVLDAVNSLHGSERVHLRGALDRVVAAALNSPLDVPSHANSAMDGFAVAARDLPRDGLRVLRIIGTSYAGKPFQAEVGRGQAVRIMTGAVMPEGTDTVVMQEHAQVNGEQLEVDARHKPGQHVRAAGEDIKRGATVVPIGQRITPSELGLIASLGIGEVCVFRRPRVAFFSTGDELRSLGEPLNPGEIYDSNRYTLFGMLTRLGCEIQDLGVVGDDHEALKSAFSAAAKDADVVITSGGVSVGEADYTKEILAATGAVGFWKVAMKPGRPLAFGHLDQALFFGLPGNPVSVMVTFYQFVQPALLKLMGCTQTNRVVVRARSVGRLKKRPGRVEYQRGRLTLDASGELCVSGTGDQGSGILSSMSAANCFIVLPMESADVKPDTLVEVQPFFGLM